MPARPCGRPAASHPARAQARPRRVHGAVPLAWAALGTAAASGVLVSLGLFFLKTGALVFGSGLAIVPLLRDGVVAQHHWLTQGQFLDAVAMA
jgi:chromate transporter